MTLWKRRITFIVILNHRERVQNIRYGRLTYADEQTGMNPTIQKGESMNKAFSNKAIGFKATLLAMLVSVVSIIVYASIYSSTRYMSWAAVGIMAAGIVASFCLILARQYRFVPTVLLVGDFIGFLFYVYYIYFYVSSVVTGIQFSGFPVSFFVNIAFMLVSVVLCVICIFMRQTPKEGKTEAKEAANGGKNG